ncbi:MAG: divalent-cation tolerance protein CutA [Pseudomonadota bacterium]
MRQVFCTCPEEKAEELASVLLQERLVACVQMFFRVRSRYWWQGRLEEAQETMLLLKTRAVLMEPLVARIRELHPYEVPEVVSVKIAEGNPDYLTWLGAETSPRQSEA